MLVNEWETTNYMCGHNLLNLLTVGESSELMLHVDERFLEQLDFPLRNSATHKANPHKGKGPFPSTLSQLTHLIYITQLTLSIKAVNQLE